MNPEGPKPGEPGGEGSSTGIKWIGKMEKGKALESVMELARWLEKIEIPEGLMNDDPKAKELRDEIQIIRTSLGSASQHPDKEVSDYAKHQIDLLRTKRSKLPKLPESSANLASPSPVEVVSESGEVNSEAEKNQLEIKLKKEQDALSEIGDSLQDLPATLDELKAHFESYSPALKMYAANTEYSQKVRQRATEALIVLLEKTGELEKEAVGKEAIAHAKKEGGAVDFDITSPQVGKSKPEEDRDKIDLEIAPELPASSAPSQKPEEVVPNVPLQDTIDITKPIESQVGTPTLEGAAPAQAGGFGDSLDFTPKKPQEEKVKFVPEKDVIVLRPGEFEEKGVQEKIRDGLRRVLRPFRKPEGKSASPEKSEASYAERAKNIIEKAKKRSQEHLERAQLLERTKKISTATYEGVMALGKKYNELPKPLKIGIGVSLAATALITGAGAALAAKGVWRLAGSVGTFATLSEALRLNYETKTGQERTWLRAGLHTAGAAIFAGLIGSGMAAEAVRELIPSGMFEWLEPKTVPEAPPVPQDPLAHAKEALAAPDKPTGYTTFDNQATPATGMDYALPEIPDYEVKSGDTMYKILKNNFEEIRNLPPGQQEAAIENILSHVKNDPASYGVSSGDVNTIFAGKDHINLEKIHELLEMPDAVKGEGIIEHVQKLDPQTIIDNKDVAPPAEITPVAPPEAVSPPASIIENNQILDETHAAMKTKLDSIFGVKNVFGAIETPGESSPAWIALKQKSIGDILAERSPSKEIMDVKNLLGNLSLESGLPVVRGEHVEDYMERALLKISEYRAEVVT